MFSLQNIHKKIARMGKKNQTTVEESQKEASFLSLKVESTAGHNLRETTSNTSSKKRKSKNSKKCKKAKTSKSTDAETSQDQDESKNVKLDKKGRYFNLTKKLESDAEIAEINFASLLSKGKINQTKITANLKLSKILHDSRRKFKKKKKTRNKNKNIVKTTETSNNNKVVNEGVVSENSDKGIAGTFLIHGSPENLTNEARILRSSPRKVSSNDKINIFSKNFEDKTIKQYEVITNAQPRSKEVKEIRTSSENTLEKEKNEKPVQKKVFVDCQRPDVQIKFKIPRKINKRKHYSCSNTDTDEDNSNVNLIKDSLEWDNRYFPNSAPIGKKYCKIAKNMLNRRDSVPTIVDNNVDTSLFYLEKIENNVKTIVDNKVDTSLFYLEKIEKNSKDQTFNTELNEEMSDKDDYPKVIVDDLEKERNVLTKDINSEICDKVNSCLVEGGGGQLEEQIENVDSSRINSSPHQKFVKSVSSLSDTRTLKNNPNTSDNSNRKFLKSLPIDDRTTFSTENLHYLPPNSFKNNSIHVATFPGTKLYFKGFYKLKLLAGSINIFGHTFREGEERVIYSPPTNATLSVNVLEGVQVIKLTEKEVQSKFEDLRNFYDWIQSFEVQDDEKICIIEIEKYESSMTQLLQQTKMITHKNNSNVSNPNLFETVAVQLIKSERFCMVTRENEEDIAIPRVELSGRSMSEMIKDSLKPKKKEESKNFKQIYVNCKSESGVEGKSHVEIEESEGRKIEKPTNVEPICESDSLKSSKTEEVVNIEEEAEKEIQVEIDDNEKIEFIAHSQKEISNVVERAKNDAENVFERTQNDDIECNEKSKSKKTEIVPEKCQKYYNKVSEHCDEDNIAGDEGNHGSEKQNFTHSGTLQDYLRNNSDYMSGNRQVESYSKKKNSRPNCKNKRPENLGNHRLFTETSDCINYVENILPRIRNHEDLSIVIAGGKDVGKSTFLKFLMNSALQSVEEIACLDLDPGQPEFSISASLTLTILSEPIFGPSYSIREKTFKFQKQIFLGEIAVPNVLFEYLKVVMRLKALYDEIKSQKNFSALDIGMDLCNSSTNRRKFGKNPKNVNEKAVNSKIIPLFVNTMGFTAKVGYDIMVDILNILKPTDLVYLESSDLSKNFAYPIDPKTISETSRGLLGRCEKHMHNYCYCKEMLNLPYTEMNYNLIKISSVSKPSKMNSKVYRELNTMSYLSQLWNEPLRHDYGMNNRHRQYPAQSTWNEEKFLTSFNCKRPIVLKWFNVAIYIQGSYVPQSHVLQSINANLVALCSLDRKYLKQENINYPKKIANIDQWYVNNEVIAWGMVRGIDTNTREIYILTPLCDQNLIKRINVIAMPKSFAPNQFYEIFQSGGGPYVS